jgi:CBS domain containing-hemolysin-like protein
VATDLVAVALCLLGSGFFSGSETALTSLPITRLEALRRSSGRLTRAGLDRWATAPQELLITILVGNNLVNVLASALATSIAYRISPNGGLAAVVGVMTLVILVFGEITPKTLAQRHAEWIAARVAPLLYLLDVVLTPVNKIFGLITRALSGSDSPELPVTEQDLLFMARLAHRHAQLPRDARFMIERVVRFQRAVAREVMVPRPLVETVDLSWSASTLRDFLTDSPHSRFPVVDGSPDDIVGVLHAKSLLRVDRGQPWTDHIVSPLFIPESKPLPELLHDLRTTGQHLAVVLDEYGGFSGVVSLEDALELVVGEIEDEFDQDQSGSLVQVEGGWSVPGRLSLRRLEVLIHRTVDEPGGVDSVGGLAAHLLGDELSAGAAAVWRGIRLEVEDIEDGRAARVRVSSLPLEGEGSMQFTT